MSAVDASILVPVLDEHDVIRETAPAMLEQRFDGEIEVIFVDGGSRDGTREYLERLARDDPRARVLHNPARRTPNALNIGLAAARGEFVARMDAHSWYPPEYVARGVDRLRRDDVTWVSGPAIPEGRGRWSRLVAAALETPFLGQGGSRKWGAGAAEVELDTGVFAGVWRRSTLQALGGWDEGWPVNQDAEMAARVLAGGGRIVCLADMGARYVPRDSALGLARQYWGFGYYRAKTARRHPGSMRRAHLLPIALGLTALAVPLPGRPGRMARRAVAAYLFGVAALTWRAAPGLDHRPRPGLPLVFAIMHLAWGGGFLAESARAGPPLAALRRAAFPAPPDGRSRT